MQEDRILAVAASGFRGIAEAELPLAERHMATIVAGDSGSGKTTALDALAFAGALVRGDAEGFLLRRGWEPESLARRGFSRRGRLFELNVRGMADGQPFLWTVQCNAADGACAAERLSLGGEQNFLLYDGSTLCIQDRCTAVCFRSEGSIMGALNRRSLPPAARRVVDLLSGVRGFGAVCPAFASRACYGVSDSIGFYGEALAGFLAGLKKEQKAALVEEMQELLPWFEGFAVRGRRDGTKDLAVLERTDGGKTLEWTAAEAGDSAVRLLAVVSMAMHFKGIPLLDEIDAGLSSQTAARLGGFLVRAGRQIVCTAAGLGVVGGMPEDSIGDCIRIALRQDGGSVYAAAAAGDRTEEPPAERRRPAMGPARQRILLQSAPLRRSGRLRRGRRRGRRG